MKYQFWKFSYIGNEEICVEFEIKKMKISVYAGNEEMYGKHYTTSKVLKCTYYGYTKDSLNEKFKEVITSKKRNQKVIGVYTMFKELKSQMKDYLIFVNGEELTKEKLEEIVISIRRNLQNY